MINTSIPHNGAFRQVSLYQIPRLGQLSEIQRTAYELYDIGFNVFPQPLGKKGGYPWKNLQYTRLDRNHTRYGVGALFAGQCNLAIMCGKTSDNLFVIDCETKASFDYHMQQMNIRSIPLWTVETGRGGHIYLRCKIGEVENISMGDTEIKGNNGYVLAPPSIHPSGAKYQWITQDGDAPPLVDVNDIDWLTDNQGNPIQLQAIPPSQKSQIKQYKLFSKNNLSRKTRNYLDNGANTPEGSRNKELFAAACDLAGNKYTESEVAQLLTPIAQKSGLPQQEIETTLRSVFSRSREPSRKSNITMQPRESWQYAMLFTSQYNWEGKSASSLHIIFLALIERCRLSGNEKGVFRASIRELATVSRLGTTTVIKLLKQLQNRNWILACGQDKISKASLWCFSDKILNEGKRIELKNDTLPSSPPWLRNSVFFFNSLDSSERGALGKGGVYLYRVMSSLDEPMMPARLSAVSGMSINRVNYALRKLSQYGLVERTVRGWRAVVVEDSVIDEQVVSGSRFEGMGDRREKRYERERSLYAGRLIYVARLRREQGRYFTSVIGFERMFAEFSSFCAGYELFEDPLLQTAFELGGVVAGVDERSKNVMQRVFLE